MPAGLLLFFPSLPEWILECFAAVRSKGGCTSVSITALRSHLPRAGISVFGDVGRCVKQAPWIRGGVFTQGIGTGAFVKAVWQDLRIFPVIYVFKIRNKFLGLLMCVPSMLPWLQLSVSAVLTRGAASRSVFSSVRATTSASASRATSWRGMPKPVKVNPALPTWRHTLKAIWKTSGEHFRSLWLFVFHPACWKQL